MANEIELKLRIDESNASLLNHHPAITDRLIEQPWTRKLVSIYYDTPNFTLLDAGLNLRVRSMSGGWFQAINSATTSLTLIKSPILICLIFLPMQNSEPRSSLFL